jgi:hypothetical protein
MSSWKPMGSAPKDGSKVLLWARLKTVPDDKPGPVVGYWHRSIERWKIAPDHLGRGEELVPSYWTEVPKAPNGGRRT